MTRTLRAVVAGLALCLGAWPGASMGGPAADAPPLLHAFSPAAIHAGDDLLIDAEFAGARPPRVFIGDRRLGRSSVRFARGAAGGAERRFWARVPKRLPAGEHTVRIATRTGAAAAAKPLVVVSCRPEPPANCGNIPDSGAELTVSGAGGYRKVLRQSSSLVPEVLFGQSNLDLFVNADLDFNMTILLEPAAIHVGSAPVLQFVYTGGPAKYWQRYDGTVRVAEESATRVGLCIDVSLVNDLPEFLGPGEPAQVTVKGYLVVER